MNAVLACILAAFGLLILSGCITPQPQECSNGMYCTFSEQKVCYEKNEGFKIYNGIPHSEVPKEILAAIMRDNSSAPNVECLHYYNGKLSATDYYDTLGLGAGSGEFDFDYSKKFTNSAQSQNNISLECVTDPTPKTIFCR